MLVPFIILLALTIAGLVRMTYMLTVLKYAGVLAVMFWLLRNAYYLAMCLFLGLGRDTDGENVKVLAAESVTVTKPDGSQFDGITTKLLEHGVDIFTDEINALSLGEPIGIEIDYKGNPINVKGTVVSLRHSRSPKIPSVYTVEILDFAGNRDEYIQMLYDRTPTLPQRIKRGEGHIDNLWNNIAHRIVAK